MARSIRVGTVLPQTYWAEEEWRNAEPALAYADEAARQGVQLLVFPEGYPGPMTGSLELKELSYRPMDGLREKARRHSMYIAAGEIEPNPGAPETFFLTLKLISPEGSIIARYLRMQPDTPPLNAYLYNGKAHLLPGNESIVVETDLGKIGLRICSELLVPELCRITMLRGAELLIAPRHGRHSKTMFNSQQMSDTWQCVARARAVENLYYVVVTQNIYSTSTNETRVPMGAFVAGPEKIVASRDTPGLLVADLDMERLAYLRNRNYDEENLSHPPEGVEPMGCRPGQIWERDPKLYSELAQPHRYSFNYHYFEESLDKWIEQYDTIYRGKYTGLQKKYGKLQFRQVHSDA